MEQVPVISLKVTDQTQKDGRYLSEERARDGEMWRAVEERVSRWPAENMPFSMVINLGALEIPGG